MLSQQFLGYFTREPRGEASTKVSEDGEGKPRHLLWQFQRDIKIITLG